METNRPKIASLSEKELATLLQESFFKIGKQLKLPVSETRIFLDEVYKYQGWMYIDIFSDAFSRYAACELPDAENLRPCVSPLFIGKLMKLYCRKRNERKITPRSGKESLNLNPEEKYNLLLKHIMVHNCLPANPDWVSIYGYLSGSKKITTATDWDSLSYSKKLKQARLTVTEWAYGHFNITENSGYKNISIPLKGIGTRLGETIWNDKL